MPSWRSPVARSAQALKGETTAWWTHPKQCVRFRHRLCINRRLRALFVRFNPMAITAVSAHIAIHVQHYNLHKLGSELNDPTVAAARTEYQPVMFSQKSTASVLTENMGADTKDSGRAQQSVGHRVTSILTTGPCTHCGD
jgi:hypothetical protein